MITIFLFRTNTPSHITNRNGFWLQFPIDCFYWIVGMWGTSSLVLFLFEPMFPGVYWIFRSGNEPRLRRRSQLISSEITLFCLQLGWEVAKSRIHLSSVSTSKVAQREIRKRSCCGVHWLSASTSIEFW